MIEAEKLYLVGLRNATKNKICKDDRILFAIAWCYSFINYSYEAIRNSGTQEDADYFVKLENNIDKLWKEL